MTDKHCESVNECANGELCAMLKNSVGLTLVGCSHFKPKQPMTNFDRITASAETLAEFMKDNMDCPACPIMGCSHNIFDCKDSWLKWLKQESKE